MKVTQLLALANRPADVPDGWLIFNAPRPPYGEKVWQGEFRHGIFYAAFDPTQPHADQFAKINADYDCWLLKYMTREEVLQSAREYYSQHGVDVDQHPFETVWQSYANRFGKTEIDLEL